MHTNTLLIGQGICGTFLQWYLERAGIPAYVIDEPRPHTPSKAAAGIINPVTGRRIVKTWMIDELLPFLQEAYARIGASLPNPLLEQRDTIDFFPTPQMRLAFLKRLEETPSQNYIQLPADDHTWDEHFRYSFGYGVISPCWTVDLHSLLSTRRKHLQEKSWLREQPFNPDSLTIEPGGIRYEDITAERIIFCDGSGSATNPWFGKLPFAPNKGEALILDIPAWRQNETIRTHLWKQGYTLAPWQGGHYWLGSSYEWDFDHANPTAAFREKAEAALKNWLKADFTTVEHIASIRPATLERRPFVGFHPKYPHIGILNGMGTKGCSLAPWFANQLVENLKQNTPIQPEADIRRFTRILSQ